MPSCPDCGLVFESLYGVQAHRRSGMCYQSMNRQAPHHLHFGGSTSSTSSPTPLGGAFGSARSTHSYPGVGHRTHSPAAAAGHTRAFVPGKRTPQPPPPFHGHPVYEDDGAAYASAEGMAGGMLGAAAARRQYVPTERELEEMMYLQNLQAEEEIKAREQRLLDQQVNYILPARQAQLHQTTEELKSNISQLKLSLMNQHSFFEREKQLDMELVRNELLALKQQQQGYLPLPAAPRGGPHASTAAASEPKKKHKSKKGKGKHKGKHERSGSSSDDDHDDSGGAGKAKRGARGKGGTRKKASKQKGKTQHAQSRARSHGRRRPHAGSGDTNSDDDEGDSENYSSSYLSGSLDSREGYSFSSEEDLSLSDLDGYQSFREGDRYSRQHGSRRITAAGDRSRRKSRSAPVDRSAGKPRHSSMRNMSRNSATRSPGSLEAADQREVLNALKSGQYLGGVAVGNVNNVSSRLSEPSTVAPPFPTSSNLESGTYQLKLASLDGIELTVPLDEVELSVKNYFMYYSKGEYVLEPNGESVFSAAQLDGQGAAGHRDGSVIKGNLYNSSFPGAGGADAHPANSGGRFSRIATGAFDAFPRPDMSSEAVGGAPIAVLSRLTSRAFCFTIPPIPFTVKESKDLSVFVLQATYRGRIILYALIFAKSNGQWSEPGRSLQQLLNRGSNKVSGPDTSLMSGRGVSEVSGPSAANANGWLAPGFTSAHTSSPVPNSIDLARSLQSTDDVMPNVFISGNIEFISTSTTPDVLALAEDYLSGNNHNEGRARGSAVKSGSSTGAGARGQRGSSYANANRHSSGPRGTAAAKDGGLSEDTAHLYRGQKSMPGLIDLPALPERFQHLLPLPGMPGSEGPFFPPTIADYFDNFITATPSEEPFAGPGSLDATDPQQQQQPLPKKKRLPHFFLPPPPGKSILEWQQLLGKQIELVKSAEKRHVVVKMFAPLDEKEIERQQEKDKTAKESLVGATANPELSDKQGLGTGARTTPPTSAATVKKPKKAAAKHKHKRRSGRSFSSSSSSSTSSSSSSRSSSASSSSPSEGDSKHNATAAAYPSTQRTPTPDHSRKTRASRRGKQHSSSSSSSSSDESTDRHRTSTSPPMPVHLPVSSPVKPAPKKMLDDAPDEKVEAGRGFMLDMEGVLNLGTSSHRYPAKNDPTDDNVNELSGGRPRTSSEGGSSDDRSHSAPDASDSDEAARTPRPPERVPERGHANSDADSAGSAPSPIQRGKSGSTDSATASVTSTHIPKSTTTGSPKTFNLTTTPAAAAATGSTPQANPLGGLLVGNGRGRGSHPASGNSEDDGATRHTTVGFSTPPAAQIEGSITSNPCATVSTPLPALVATEHRAAPPAPPASIPRPPDQPGKLPHVDWGGVAAAKLAPAASESGDLLIPASFKNGYLPNTYYGPAGAALDPSTAKPGEPTKAAADTSVCAGLEHFDNTAMEREGKHPVNAAVLLGLTKKEAADAARADPNYSALENAIVPTTTQPSTDLFLDGVVGLPLDAACTRLLVYLVETPHLEGSAFVTSNGAFNLHDTSLFFTRKPDYVIYQSLGSSTMEPEFPESSRLVKVPHPTAPRTNVDVYAVVVIEYANETATRHLTRPAGQPQPRAATPSTEAAAPICFGHCVIPIKVNGISSLKPGNGIDKFLLRQLANGNYVARVKQGDPRRSQERKGPEEFRPASRIKEEQKRDLEKYTQGQFESSMCAQCAKSLLFFLPKKRSECVPASYVIFRLNSGNMNAPAFRELPMQVPFSQQELAIHDIRQHVKTVSRQANSNSGGPPLGAYRDSTPLLRGVADLPTAENLFHDKPESMKDKGHLSGIVPYSSVRGLFARPERLRGLGDDPATYAVVVRLHGPSVNCPPPPGGSGRRVFATVMPDWLSDVGALQYKDPPFVAQGVGYDSLNVVVFTVLKITNLAAPRAQGGAPPPPPSPSPKVEAVGWTVNKLFLDEPGILRSGRFILPLLAGQPSPQILHEFMSAKLDLVYVNNLKKRTLGFMSPRATLTISQGDPAMCFNIVDATPFQSLGHQLLMPTQLKNEFPCSGNEGMIGCLLKTAHERIFGGGDPRAFLQRVGNAVQGFVQATNGAYAAAMGVPLSQSNSNNSPSQSAGSAGGDRKASAAAPPPMAAGGGVPSLQQQQQQQPSPPQRPLSGMAGKAATPYPPGGQPPGRAAPPQAQPPPQKQMMMNPDSRPSAITPGAKGPSQLQKLMVGKAPAGAKQPPGPGPAQKSQASPGA